MSSSSSDRLIVVTIFLVIAMVTVMAFGHGSAIRTGIYHPEGVVLRDSIVTGREKTVIVFREEVKSTGWWHVHPDKLHKFEVKEGTQPPTQKTMTAAEVRDYLENTQGRSLLGKTWDFIKKPR